MSERIEVDAKLRLPLHVFEKRKDSQTKNEVMDIDGTELELYYPRMTVKPGEKRGRCLILACYTRLISKQKAEIERIKRTFENLDYECIVYKNDEPQNRITQVSKKIREESARFKQPVKDDSFVLWILTSGLNGGIEDEVNTLNLENILDVFNAKRSPSLAMKPKLVFIQQYTGKSELQSDSSDRSKTEQRIPTYADFLIFYYNQKDQSRFRCSSFIEHLCTQLETESELELTARLTQVTEKMKQEKNSVPQIFSTLTKLVRLER